MNDNTNWTPSTEDNKLGLVDKKLMNEYEAKGNIDALYYLMEVDLDSDISTQMLLKFHYIAFSELYEWAGKWRTTDVIVGQITPPPPNQILQLMYQFIDNLNFKISISTNFEQKLDCLVYAHYEFIKIHPFTNGNGRTGRALLNFVGSKFGFEPIQLYYIEGNNRKTYIDAMKQADIGNFEILKSLIRKELIPD
jgi:cell filamentation protein